MDERLSACLVGKLLALFGLPYGSLIPHGNKEALFPIRIRFFDPELGNKEHQDCPRNALRSPSLFPGGSKNAILHLVGRPVELHFPSAKSAP